MKYIMLYIFLLIIFIIFMSYVNVYLRTPSNDQEPFNSKINDEDTIILIGDSILKNDLYVSNNSSIEHLINQNDVTCVNFAQDGAIITDCFYQLEKIPSNLNNKRTTIYLSVGGNDIIERYIERNILTKNTDPLTKMFHNYKKLVKSIQTKMDLSKLILIDIYYPPETFYKKYHGIINKWNNMLYKYASTQKNNIYEVLKVSEIMNQKMDFVYAIEPSEIGGEKIVNLIMDAVSN